METYVGTFSDFQRTIYSFAQGGASCRNTYECPARGNIDDQLKESVIRDAHRVYFDRDRARSFRGNGDRMDRIHFRRSIRRDAREADRTAVRVIGRGDV